MSRFELPNLLRWLRSTEEGEREGRLGEEQESGPCESRRRVEEDDRLSDNEDLSDDREHCSDDPRACRRDIYHHHPYPARRAVFAMHVLSDRRTSDTDHAHTVLVAAAA